MAWLQTGVRFEQFRAATALAFEMAAKPVPDTDPFIVTVEVAVRPAPLAGMVACTREFTAVATLATLTVAPNKMPMAGSNWPILIEEIGSVTTILVALPFAAGRFTAAVVLVAAAGLTAMVNWSGITASADVAATALKAKAEKVRNAADISLPFRNNIIVYSANITTNTHEETSINRAK